MKSPFPGMDPYLERYWRDVHHRLITYAADQLQEQLPADLRAMVEERVFVEIENGYRRSPSPDVQVIEERQGMPGASARSADVAVAEPLVIEVPAEPISQGYINVLDIGSGNRVITTIEFISPSNKLPGDGRRLYCQKQEEMHAGGVNLVEVDLTRTGEWVFAVPTARIPQSHRTTYLACTYRASKPRQYEVYRAPLRERLPTIRVPLRKTDSDATLDLQSLVDLCYQRGRYAQLDYTVDPDPPLESGDAVWATELLRAKGLR
jgi:hypothetical protein